MIPSPTPLRRLFDVLQASPGARVTVRNRLGAHGPDVEVEFAGQTHVVSFDVEGYVQDPHVSSALYGLIAWHRRL